MGHEYVGIVKEIGSEVTHVKPGQFVVGSFFASDNTCDICRSGYQSRCVHAELIGTIGTQAEYACIPLADGTLVATPETPEDNLVPGLLAASDVLGTGWFAAVAAEAGPGKTVAVVGDGAVGLHAVLAARELGAGRIIAMSRPSRARSSLSSTEPPTSWSNAVTRALPGLRSSLPGSARTRSSRPSAPRSR
jgi:threonine dehydrogenase-like Zn-dependent dehydrogenase